MSFRTWREYVASQPQCNFKVTKNPLTASFTHPGLNFTDFGRDYNIGILSLMNLVVDIRTFATYQPYNDKGDTWFDLKEAAPDNISFVSSTSFSISRAMYDKTVPKWPLEAKVSLGFVGNSTILLPAEVYVPGSKEPLLTQWNQIVNIDGKTRRPKPYPEWFKDKYKSQCTMDKGFRLETFKRPEETFSYRRQIFWLDTDQNNHTNYATYVRFAVDGIWAALKEQEQKEEHSFEPADDRTKSTNFFSSPHSSSVSDADTSVQRYHSQNKALKGLTADIVRAGVKSLKVCYVKECGDGDVVDVHIWQEEGEGFLVRCSLEMAGRLLCQIQLEYYSPLSKL